MLYRDAHSMGRSAQFQFGRTYRTPSRASSGQ